MSGQSIVDRFNAAKCSIAGQGLKKSVCKATTEEILGPKKKHVDYLVQCTKEPNVSIPILANLLIERTQQEKWVIVFKALITIHNLMNYGNERFTQYLASNTGFHLDGFSDKSTVQETGGSESSDMSKFIQRYAKYIQEKSASYRVHAFDFCKIKRGKDDGVLRTMNGEKLLKTLPSLQAQLDALIAFDAQPNEMTNNVIHSAFVLLFRDSIRLFACYNEGIINLLEKYFEMNKKQCKEGLDIYKKFLVRMDQVSEFLKVAENMGVDKGDIPDLAKAPSSLLDALESHLQSLEGKKGGSTPTGSDRPAGFTNTVNNFSKASSGGVGASSSVSPTLGITEDERRKALEQEEQTMQQLKMAASSPTQPMPQRHLTQQASPTAVASQPQTQSTNPFLGSGVTAGANDTVDLFGSSTTFQTQPQQQTLPSDDLLSLGSSNPFSQPSMTTTSPGQPANNFMAQPATNPWAGTDTAANNMNFGMTAPATNNEINFEAAFGATNQPVMGARTNGFLAGQSVLPPPATTLEESLDPLAPNAPSMQPTSPGLNIQATSQGLVQTATSPGLMAAPAAPAAPAPRSGYDGFGDVMQPAARQPHQQQGSKLIKEDLDSSLANIAGNLNINGPGMGQHLKKTEHQWSPSANKGQKTGGANWQTPMPSATFSSWSQPGMPGPRPGMGMQPQQPGMFQPTQQPPMGVQPNLFQQPTRPQQTQHHDPFGAL